MEEKPIHMTPSWKISSMAKKEHYKWTVWFVFMLLVVISLIVSIWMTTFEIVPVYVDLIWLFLVVFGTVIGAC